MRRVLGGLGDGGGVHHRVGAAHGRERVAGVGQVRLHVPGGPLLGPLERRPGEVHGEHVVAGVEQCLGGGRPTLPCAPVRTTFMVLLPIGFGLAAPAFGRCRAPVPRPDGQQRLGRIPHVGLHVLFGLRHVFAHRGAGLGRAALGDGVVDPLVVVDGVRPHRGESGGLMPGQAQDLRERVEQRGDEGVVGRVEIPSGGTRCRRP